MSKPVYLYFQLRARGELPRLVAAAGGVDYEDRRLTFNEWPEYKPKAPYGQVPVLIVDGKYYAQKLAISLFFARKAGLYPTSGNPLELLKYDDPLNFSEEVLENIVQARVDKTFNKKPETLEKLKSDVLPNKIPLLEKVLKASGTGFFVGDKLSIVDLSAFDVLDHVVELLGKAYLDATPLLAAHYTRVSSIPGVKKYLASRGASDL